MSCNSLKTYLILIPIRFQPSFLHLVNACIPFKVSLKKMAKISDKKPAKVCYEHIGGRLGMLLLDQFISKGWLAKDNPADKHYYITEKGVFEFTKLGIDLSEIKS